MSYTVTQARDTIATHFLESWVNAGYSADNVLFDDVPTDNNPDSDQTWCRLTLRHGPTVQRTLADALGKACFERVLTITVQIFCPRGTGLALPDEVVQNVLDMFERTRVDGVVFRDTTFREIGIDGAFFNVNVSTVALYNELK